MSDRKKEIMNGAIKVLSEKGYRNTRVSDIVKEVGIAQGTFYNYFKSKKSLFLQLIEEFNKILLERLTNITIEDINKPLEVEGRIKMLYQVVFQTYQENAMLAKVMLREAVAIDKDFEKKKRELYELISEYIKGSLEIGIKKGIFYNYNFEIISSAIIGMVENVAYDFLVDKKDRQMDELIDNMARFETLGLLKR